jgi:hypothetical protein
MKVSGYVKGKTQNIKNFGTRWRLPSSSIEKEDFIPCE